MTNLNGNIFVIMQLYKNNKTKLNLELKIYRIINTLSDFPACSHTKNKVHKILNLSCKNYLQILSAFFSVFVVSNHWEKMKRQNEDASY